MNGDGTMEGMAPAMPGNGPMGMDMCMGMDGQMTHMTFYWGKNAWILFQGWPGSNAGMYILSLVFVFSLAMIMEWLAHNNPLPTKSSRVARTMLYALRVVFSYFLMLSVMSFNIGIFVVAIGGHAIGFYVFRMLKQSLEEDSDLIPMTC